MALVPFFSVLTSDTGTDRTLSPGMLLGTVSYSSQHFLGPGYNAFGHTGIYPDVGYWLPATSDLDPWLRYDWPHKKIAMTWQGAIGVGFGNAVTSFELQGSNDGTTWTQLKSVLGTTLTVAGLNSFTYPLAAPAKYSSHRVVLHLNAPNSFNDYGDYQLFGFYPPPFFD